MRPQAVILAAGRGTRMRSARPKVLHEVLGQPLLETALGLAAALAADPVCVVLGHGAAEVEARFAGRARFVRQDPPLGTGHAVMAARATFAAHPERPLLVLNADLPLLRASSLMRLLDTHVDSEAALTLLSAVLAEGGGAYGRVVRGQQGQLLRVVEAQDAGPAELALSEINAGVYVFDVARLLPALDRLQPDNAQGEYYLTDVVAQLGTAGEPLRVVVAGDPEEVLGVNTLAECAAASARRRTRVLRGLMESGVVVEDPVSTWVGPEVVVEPDVVLRPGTLLEGRCHVESGAVIGPASRLTDVRVGRGARVLDHCVLQECVVGAGAQVGPFSHVRPGTRLGERSRVGNFVELKKTSLGEGSKASHLSYLGDAEIGRDVNIGAGTITCNYDGQAKHPTRIGDGAFIGSDATLVAPIQVGAGAYVAAGSAITADVEPEALALGRARQVVKPGWARRRRERRCEDPG